MKRLHAARTTSPLTHTSTMPAPSATDVAERLHFTVPDTINELHMMMRHPRSLARPMATWRPPRKDLPVLPRSGDLHTDAVTAQRLTSTLTRYRVGPRARARVHSYGETREPAYLISLRVTSPEGTAPSPVLAEAWMRALVDESRADAVHEIATSSATTFVWLVDRDFVPVHSPVSLFEDFAAAA
ncbi:hypothetical protein [uncultured Corynebacterium sp.]|uniref:hypothetical protein n=1 Tax=uncultured Corynebacterium sp. TaxID=159447 RepID=UPI0025F91BF2|nr:hypothetical protein [uncultured Corynebacterium sp.]